MKKLILALAAVSVILLLVGLKAGAEGTNVPATIQLFESGNTKLVAIITTNIVIGQKYRIQRSTNLTSWENIHTNPTTVGPNDDLLGYLERYDQPKMFYRVIWVP